MNTHVGWGKTLTCGATSITYGGHEKNTGETPEFGQFVGSWRKRSRRRPGFEQDTPAYLDSGMGAAGVCAADSRTGADETRDSRPAASGTG